MPVRKIPKSFRAVTGRFPSRLNKRCVGYESKLEHDYFLTSEFDPTIRCYEEQPVKVSELINGRTVTYVLDCLTTFKDDRPKLLVEVKYTKDLIEQADKLEAKFIRSRKYAAENDLEFRIISEKDLDNVALANYRLIYRFVKPPTKIELQRKLIIEALRKTGTLTLRELKQSFGESRIVQADYTPGIWHMLYTREIETDLSKPINYDTVLRISNGQNLIS